MVGMERHLSRVSCIDLGVTSPRALSSPQASLPIVAAPAAWAIRATRDF